MRIIGKEITLTKVWRYVCIKISFMNKIRATRLNKHNRVYIFKYNNNIISTKIRLYLPYYDTDHIQKNIFQYNTFYEIHILEYMKKYINSSSIVVDAGANIGNHTVYFSKILNANHVYSFEPIPDTFSILKRNVELNNIQDVTTLENKCLGFKKGHASLVSYDKTNIGGTILKSDENGNYPLISLDEYFQDKEKPTIIKIDVEGFEQDVLKGAETLLEETHPLLFIEIWDQYFEIVNEYLLRFNYKLQKKYSETYIYKFISE